MPESTSPIGVVTVAYGSATAEGVDGVRTLSANSPVYADDVIKTTGPGSAVELKFVDGALLSQGPNSTTVLDTYVFDPDQSTGEMAVKLLQGTFRSVTGDIVDMNPEGFKLETPMATIGIRGTTTGHTVLPDGRETHAVVDFVDRPVVIRPSAGGPIQVVSQDGMAVGASSGGISTAFRASQSQLAAFQQLSSQSLMQGAPSFDTQAAEKDAEEAAKQAAEKAQEAEDAAEDAAEAVEEAAAAEAAAQAAADAAAQAAAEAAAAQAAAEAAAAAAAQDAAAQAAAEAAAAEAAAAQAAAEAAAQAAAEAAQAAAEAAAQAAAAQAAAAAAAADAAAAQAAAQAAAISAAASQAASQPGPVNTPDPDGGDDAGDDGGDDGPDDSAGPGNTLDPGGDPTSDPAGPPGPPPVPGPLPPTPTGPVSPPPPVVPVDPDLDPEAPQTTITATMLDLSGWGDNLVVDLLGGGNYPRDVAYYESEGNSDDTEVHRLEDSGDTAYDIETVIGAMPFLDSDGESVITPDNNITANDNDNYIYGGSGANYLDGGAGDDLLGVGTYDTLAQTYTLGEISKDDTIIGGSGSDTLTFDGNDLDSMGGAALDNVSSIEGIVTGSAVVNIVATPDAMVEAGETLVLDASLSSDVTFWANGDTNSHFYMISGDGDDHLKGAALADTLFGGAGNDCLEGLGGDDTLSGTGGGNDTLLGGTGSDAIYMGTKLNSSDVVNGGIGAEVDTLYFTDNGSGTDDLDGVSYIEAVVLGAAATNITVGASGIAPSGTAVTVDGTATTSLNLDLSGLSTDNTFAVYGGLGADSITGSLYDETLDGGLGNDTLLGGGGADSLDGDFGVDSMLGGAGNDTFFFSSLDVQAGEVINGGGDTDEIRVDGIVDFTGASITDVEVIQVGDSDTATFDEVNSASVTWAVKGNASAGTVETFRLDVNSTLGGALDANGLTFSQWNTGEDLIYLDGSVGKDTLTGSDQDEIFDGGAEGDSISGAVGDDTIDGGSGNDTLDGGSGSNSIDGGSGDDSITSAGSDTVIGGLGEDTILINSNTVSVDGGLGDDTLFFMNTNDVSATTITGIETLRFNTDSQTTMAASQLCGTTLILDDMGDLTLSKPTGAQDTDLSGLQMATFTGGLFINLSDTSATLNMGENMSSQVVVNGGSGADILIYTDDGTGADELDNVTGVETIRFGDASTSVILGGNIIGNGTILFDGTAISGGNTLSLIGTLVTSDNLAVSGSSCDDSIVGGGGNDSLDGNSGDDTLWGGDGNDYLEGDLGADSMFGGAGDDTFIFKTGDIGAGEAVYGGDDTLDSGTDTVLVQTSTDFNPMGPISGIEVLQIVDGQTATFDFGMEGFFVDLSTLSGGSAGTTETVLLQGTAGADVLNISDASYSVTNWTGDDDFLIQGMAGDDEITGSGGADHIEGGDDDDLLIGFGGDDSLVGGLGNDTIEADATDGASSKLEGGDGDDELLVSGYSTGTMIFDGGAGQDTMLGGADNINEFVFKTGDVVSGEVIEGGDGSGTNTIVVETSTDFTGAVISEIDQLNVEAGATATFTENEFGSGWAVYGVGTAGTTEVLEINLAGTDVDFSFGSVDDFTTGEDYTVVTGGGGNDTIGDSAADDHLIGGAGADSLKSSAGADTLEGGLGNDTLFVQANSDITTIDGGDGSDTLHMYLDMDLSSADISDIEVLHFQSGSTTFTTDQISGQTYAVTSDSSPVDMVVAATTGDDVVDLSTLDLSGFSKQITVNLDDGDDLLTMGTNMSDGTYIMAVDGGSGDDTLSVLESGSTTALDNVSAVENVVFGDMTTAVTLAESLADTDVTVTIDATAMTGTNTLTFNASGTENNSYVILGGDGEDTLSGGVGDVLTGGSGDDSIDGGAGADTLNGGFGNDTLEGGDGNDSMTGVAMNYSDGNDSMLGGAGEDTIKGQHGNDYIDGGDDADLIYGEGSSGLAGNDTIYGGAGNDTIYGDGGTSSSGADLIFGGLGDDEIYGTDGDDTIEGGAGADTLSGGTGTDILSYASDTTGVTVNLNLLTATGGDATGDDITADDFEGVLGGTGDDSITGTAGAESLSGGDGNDTITGAGGSDTLEGGLGNDLFHFSGTMGAGGVIDGGDGADTIYMSLSSEDFSEAASISDIETLVFAHAGGDSDATFNVSDLYSWTVEVDGGASSYTQTLAIAGTAGDDVINLAPLAFSTGWDTATDIVSADAGEGNDLVLASASVDSLIGGIGVDTVNYSSSTAGVEVNLDAGTGSGGYADGDTLSGFEAVIGSDHDDVLMGATSSDNYLSAGTGDDLFAMQYNMDSNDTLDGGAGDDSLGFVYSGDANTLTNVTGVEHITLGDAATTLSGHDTLSDFLSTLTVDATGLTGANNLTWNGNFIANIYQNILGSDADDSIRGGTNQDTLEGNAGRDSLEGVDGNDSLSGGAGQDVLEGGGGDDFLDGGANDRYLREMDVAKYANESSAINADLSAGTVTGGGGNDTLTGIEGIWGTTGNDTFVGDSSWANIFIDGGGSDNIDGGSVHDSVADTGFDIAAYYESTVGINVAMTGTSGTVTVGGDVDTLTNIDLVWGSTHDDTMTGDGSDQEFMTDLGSDSVDGGGGGADDDSVGYWNLTDAVTVTWDGNSSWNVVGSGWTDTLTDIERIEGSQGADSFTGNDGDNVFSGWKGDDTIDGGGGTYNWADYSGDIAAVDVVLDSGTATDGWGDIDTLLNIQSVEGSDFDDTISGTTGSNVLEGGAGDDWIDGFGGQDTLRGDGGNDTISVQDTLTSGSVIEGGEGVDEIQASVALSGVTTITGVEKLIIDIESVVGLNGSAVDGQTWEVSSLSDSGAGTSVNVFAAQGSSVDLSGWTYGEWNEFGNDSLTISGYNDSLIGEAIVASLASEMIIGYMGNDTLSGGLGDDTFMYNSGAEVLSQGTGGDVIMDFVSGTDSVLFGGGFGDLLWYEEDNYDGIIDGIGSTADVLVWDSANHKLWYDQDATVSNPATEGVVATFSGSSVAMTDVMIVDSSISAGTVGTGQSWSGSGGNDTYTGTDYDDTISGLAGEDTLWGGLGADSIMGGDGDDVLWGSDGSSALSDIGDYLSGGLGNDLLSGEYGSDTLDGGDGNDTLRGGHGSDVLTGGDGADEFLYESASAVTSSDDSETITDFSYTYDYVWLSGDLGTQDYAWLTADSFTGENGSSGNAALVMDTLTGALWYDADDTLAGGDEGVIATPSGDMMAFGSVFSDGGIITNAMGFTVMAGAAGMDDTLTAPETNFNVLFGYDGNDSLVGGSGNEYLIGGTGQDTYEGGGGQDTVSFVYDDAGVHVDLYGSGFGGISSGIYILDGEGNMEAVSGVEHVAGSYYDDMLGGDAGNNSISGFAGNDLIYGGQAGADTLSGGEGSDTFAIFGVTEDGRSILDFDATDDQLALHPTGDFNAFFMGDFSAMFDVVISSSSYGDIGTNANIGSGEGLIYVSGSGSSTGQLWYDPDCSVDGGDEVLLLDITEYDSGVEADQNLTAADFEAMVLPEF